MARFRMRHLPNPCLVCHTWCIDSCVASRNCSMRSAVLRLEPSSAMTNSKSRWVWAAYPQMTFVSQSGDSYVDTITETNMQFCARRDGRPRSGGEARELERPWERWMRGSTRRVIASSVSGAGRCAIDHLSNEMRFRISKSIPCQSHGRVIKSGIRPTKCRFSANSVGRRPAAFAIRQLGDKNLIWPAPKIPHLLP